MAALQQVNRRDNQINALKRRVDRLDAERLAEYRAEITRAWEAETIAKQVSLVAEVFDRTPSDFRVVSAHEKRRLIDFNDPSFFWGMYCRDLGRSVALAEKSYIFSVLAESVRLSEVRISSKRPRFGAIFEEAGALVSSGCQPDVLLAPIQVMVPFYKWLSSRLAWGTHPREVLTTPHGPKLRVFWSSRSRPLDRFIIFDSAGALWTVKPDPQTGHHLTVAIGESADDPAAVEWLAETVVHFRIIDPNAFRALGFDGDLKEEYQDDVVEDEGESDPT